MRPVIEHAILAISDSFAASIVAKATIVSSLALVAAALARRSRASIRHAILAAGFAVLLALPIAAIVAPPIHIALAQSQAAPSAELPQSLGEVAPAPTTNNVAPNPAQAAPQQFPWLDLLFAAWAIGTLIFFAPVVIGLWQVPSLRRTALPWSHGNSVAAKLAGELGLRRRVEVLLHESVNGPMTCGILRPAIVFPVEAENWDNSDLNRAIAHELEHVRRADWLTHCLARAVCAAYWFHPLVWIAWRKLTLEAERACDDAVLSRSEPTAYAEQLVALARQLTAANKSPLLAMASRSDLTARVNAVLDARQPRGRPTRFVIALLCAAMVLLTVAISPVTIIAAQPQSSTEDWEKAAGGKMSFDVASIRPGAELGPLTPVLFGLEPGGLVRGLNYPLLGYIAFAYKLDTTQERALRAQIPSWARKTGFDIEARPSGHGSTRDQERLMMQSLLAERFKLAAHFETKDGPAWALVLAKTGKLGSEMRTFPDGFPCSEDRPSAAAGRGGPAPIVPTVDEGRLPASCGSLQFVPTNETGILHRAGRDVSVDDLVDWIRMSGDLDRPLVDKTGLSGTFDLSVRFPLEIPPGPDAAADNAAAFLQALNDQLGLKLEPITAPVHTLVIDHIEPPTPN